MTYEGGVLHTVSFTRVGGNFLAPFFVRDVLTYDETEDKYTLVSMTGTAKIFFGDSGLLAEMRDRFGNATTFTYSDGLLSRVVVGGETASPVSYLYATDGSSGLVNSVTLAVAETEVRRTVYAYTEAGELESVTLQQKSESGTWDDIQTSYFRYYPEGVGQMRFSLGNDAILQMRSVEASWPESAADAVVAQYADRAFAYDDRGRVSSLATNGGKYTSAFSYAESANSGSTPNVWKSKTTISQPDGSTQTLYYTRAGSLLLKQVSEPQPDGPPRVWYPVCQQFDENARVILQADSSAVASVDESSATLFTLEAEDGENTIFEYDDDGNLLATSLRKGAGSAVPLVTQQESAYDSHEVGGVPLWFRTSDTVYREATDTGATGPVTTLYDYEWHQSGGVDTAQLSKKTTTLPAVPATENGDGNTATLEDHYDERGFRTKQVDELNVATTYQFVLETGAVAMMVQDAGGLNLTTDYQSDSLGRTIRTLGPEHTVSLDGTAVLLRRAGWTQYLDLADEVRNIRGFVNSSDSSEVTVNPVRIQRTFRVDPEVTGGRMTAIISAVYAGMGVPAKTASYAQTDWVRWSTQHYDKGGEQTHARIYHLIPDSGSGISPDNYAQTAYGYDSVGRQNQVTSPEGTIQKTVFNAMGWQTESLVGTSAENLVTTALRDYDDGNDRGDGNLTKNTLKVDDDSAHDRIQNLSYDWRNRQTGTSASDGTTTIRSVRTYDNRNNVTQADEYQNIVSTSTLINRAASLYDGRNRLYQTKRYGVDISDGSLQPALTGNTYFDQINRTVRQTPAGKTGFTVNHYDALGRVLKTFRAFGPGPDDVTPWDPSDISTATVQTQAELAYDDADNQVSTTTRQRFDDAAGTGELGDPATEPKARVSYSASYPDPVGRSQANADYGTNGGDAWTRSDTIPARSDTVLVAGSGYDDAGNPIESTDPMGIVTRQEFDNAGRRVTLLENYVSPGSSNPDVNKTTYFGYNLDGNLKLLTAVNPDTGNQITEWIYGVTVAQGSALESNALLFQKNYPAATAPVSYQYNRQGQQTVMVDQAGTTHGYLYDGFGRQVSDAVSAFGTGVETTVQAITRNYEVRGMLAKITSLGASATVLNEVLMVYDAYSQLVKDYQAHGSAVDTGTTLNVGYTYADGSDNMVRPIGIVYPDGSTTIVIAYDGTDSDALSRPDALKEGMAKLCSYRYLGLTTFIDVKYGDT